jgi:hypothetical protein
VSARKAIGPALACAALMLAVTPSAGAKVRSTRVLATGDSMIQLVDISLERRLERHRGFRVRSDAHISTGLSKNFLLDWPDYAKTQMRRYRPRATVMFIGANDGFPLRSLSGKRIRCCRDAWIDAYARKVGSMMDTYSRSGASQVYWLTLPAPRPGHWRPVYRAVNRAIKRAARTRRKTATVVDIWPTFTPRGRFRASIRWHGRYRTVRQADGVHLNVLGASIAAGLVTRAMRADGLFSTS